ncbi:hypothetical protein [Streptomyces montanisoli]|uniref:Uncharacterized protein n=1 Tax=Streptomyces montanisoli TaxID=2798581 RepID=A0A940MEC6_9ACTN|nr:hypothetical protein [Streptomyces montanisoli]MBP0457128.1 hypothetical protein [Streptomyces montanisoli]
MNATTLRTERLLRAGQAPAFVSADAGAKVLLALSEDGSLVTGLDLQRSPGQQQRVVVRRRVALGPGPDREVDGPARNRVIEFHTIGPRRVSHYEGDAGQVRETASIPFQARAATGDLVKVSRLYAAEKGTDRLVAIDVAPGGDELRLVAQARLGEPVLYLGADENRLYAVTRDRLVVLKTNSFEGFEGGRFTVLATIDLRTALRGSRVRNAPVSGIAVGPDRVYLTVQGRPYVLSIAKPDL